MKQAHLVAALVLGGVNGPAAALLQEAGGPRVQFKAYCTFEREGALLDLSGSANVRESLRRHANGHGWRWELDSADLVDPARAAPCPARILHQMEVPPYQDSDGFDIFLLKHFAQALDRNHRVDEALALLEQALDEPYLQGSEALQEMHASFLSQWAARVAAHAGRWKEALVYAEGWHTTSTCGLGASSEASAIRLFRARCLLSVERNQEAIELIRSQAQTSWIGPEALELWITGELAEGHARTAERAAELVRTQLAAKSEELLDRTLESWSLVRASRQQQVGALNELADYHPELALELLLSLDATEMELQMRAFDVVDGKRRWPCLADLLIELGLPEVGPVLDRALSLAQDDSQRFGADFDLQHWRNANERWEMLTEWRR
jgi:hypothetical protein